MRIYFILLFLLLASTSHSTLAIDHIRVAGPMSATDKRGLYKNEILKLTLDASTDRYGEYTLSTSGPIVSRARARNLLIDGDIINLHVSTGIEFFEFSSITIRANLRKGLSSFQMLLVPSINQDAFKNVNTLDRLRQFKAGIMPNSNLGMQLEVEGFTVEESHDFDGLFQMLAGQRYDFTARGTNEAYKEINSGLPAFDSLVIVPDVAIYTPMSTYIFVSRNYPKIAERINYGLRVLRNNGTFDDIFFKHYGESLKKAGLLNRKIITINNHGNNMYENSEIWQYLKNTAQKNTQ